MQLQRTLLVHSSLRSLGGASAADVIDGLRDALGEEGTLVFPTLSYRNCNPNNPVFDYYKTQSNVGYLPEYFRTEVKGVIRSMNPTHSCAAIGKNAEFVTSGHILDKTPCGANSPFRRIMELNGKILFLGCGMNCNTSMHAVEELSEPSYLYGGEFEYTFTDANGKEYKAPPQIEKQRQAGHPDKAKQTSANQKYSAFTETSLFFFHNVLRSFWITS